MKISFVIPAYNEEVVIADCLTSVLAALKATPCDAEVIVVNNASTDRTKEIASSFEDVRVVDEPHKGLVWARRAGFLASSGNLIANIDADTLMPAAWLPKVIAEFSADPNLLALSGPYIYYDAPWLARITTSLFYVVGFVINRVNEVFFTTSSMLQGGNFVLRRSALEKIGGFDTSIEFYGEDIDIGRRVGKIGKVKWTFRLPMRSSGRRFSKQGILKAGILYALNFIWVTFRGKPFTQTHVDIRTNNK